MIIISTDILLRLMLERDLGVVELARKAGITPTSISRIVGGQARVTIPTLGKIAKALGVDYSELIKKEEPVK